MESTQYICCKFIFLRNFINVFACKMVILFNNLSILLPETVLENCLETPGLKPFSTLCAKLRCSLFFQLEPSFFQLESLFKFRRLASPFDLYLFLFCLWNCSTCIYLWLKIGFRKRWIIFSFFWVNVMPYFHVWTSTHVLQFPSGTVPLNFVWLSHNALH